MEKHLHGLRDRRQALNLTAAELATFLGVSVPNLYAWENGQRTIPEPYLERLAAVFGMDVDVFRAEDEATHEVFREQAIAAVTAVTAKAT